MVSAEKTGDTGWRIHLSSGLEPLDRLKEVVGLDQDET